jgi:dihydrofolate reductase
MKADARRAGTQARRRKIVVNIATSADGYIARPDGNIDWLTSRPAPKGFYGIAAFERTIDAILLGRKTFDLSLELGARFGGRRRTYVFSRRPPPASLPRGVEFVRDPVERFVTRLREQRGKNIWMMGGGDIIASFLDAGAIDEFIISIVPVLIGEGIPLIGPRHREQPLALRSVKRFPDGVVQVHYQVRTAREEPR